VELAFEPMHDRCPTTCMTGRRRAKRGGNRTATPFGAPVDAEVMRHLVQCVPKRM
jgi:hypothetical protein